MTYRSDQSTHPLPGFELLVAYNCAVCQQPAQLLGQYAPHMPHFVCKSCAEKNPYPIHVFVENTRNPESFPLMIDPAASSEDREKRMWLDEMVKWAARGVDDLDSLPPVTKYNLSGLELRNPIRRSKVVKFRAMSAAHVASRRLVDAVGVQIDLPICTRCGCVHDHAYEMYPGHIAYKAKCQRCDDESAVEALFRNRGVFGKDDDEGALDRMQVAFPELFERGILPDYWFILLNKV